MHLRFIALPALRPVLLISLLGLFFLPACEPVDPNADVADLPLEWDWKRTDHMMWAYAKAIQADSTLRPDEGFNQYLAEEADFFLTLAGKNPNRPLRPGEDSLLKASLHEVLADSLVFALLDTVQQAFPTDYDFTSGLEPALKRLQREFPEVNALPTFRTHVNGFQQFGDWRSVDQIQLMPGYVSFGLHYFLGPDYPYYPPQVYQYQRKRFQPDYMAVRLLREIADEFITPAPGNKQPSLADMMIEAGKRQYFVSSLLRGVPDSLIMRYSSEQMAWAEHFEEKNYAFLVDKLFETNFKLQQEYLGDKGFTSSLSRESAPRIGEYLGWKIVQSYMREHPAVSLAELCQRTDYEVIFRESRYKP
ncbi:MAG: hypothetical protein AAFR61_24530 [Bacteroidota bacterium]